MRRLPLAVCILAAACSSSTPAAPAPVDEQVTLAPGQRVTISGTTTALVFTGVTSDSRCPAAAICVWAGDAAARFEIASNRASEVLELHTTLQPNLGQAAGFTLHLLQVAPYPITGNDIKPADYRATVRVTR